MAAASAANIKRVINQTSSYGGQRLVRHRVISSSRQSRKIRASVTRWSDPMRTASHSESMLIKSRSGAEPIDDLVVREIIVFWVAFQAAQSTRLGACRAVDIGVRDRLPCEDESGHLERTNLSSRLRNRKRAGVYVLDVACSSQADKMRNGLAITSKVAATTSTVCKPPGYAAEARIARTSGIIVTNGAIERRYSRSGHVHTCLTTIRRNPVSPISAVPQGKLWIRRKYRFGFVGIKAAC